jgi:hypothetical protein
MSAVHAVGFVTGLKIDGLPNCCNLQRQSIAIPRLPHFCCQVVQPSGPEWAHRPMSLERRQCLLRITCYVKDPAWTEVEWGEE